MSSITEVSEVLTEVLNKTANRLARETDVIKRVRNLNGADFAQSLIFGWLQDPDISLEGLCQVMGRREGALTASGLCQRFTPESAEFFRRILEELSAHHLRAEESVPPKVLQHFQAVLLEASSIIGLPKELSVIWKGCGGHPGASEGGVKLYVRWDVLTGYLDGPRLTDAKNNDRHSPFEASEIAAGALYLADLGFFGLPRLQSLMQRQGRVKGSVITRMLHRTNLSLRNGHLLALRGVLPRKVGEAREMGVLVGKTARVPMRLILVRVPKKVGNQRREQIKEDAKDHAREPSEEMLYLADWTILLRHLSLAACSPCPKCW